MLKKYIVNFLKQLSKNINIFKKYLVKSNPFSILLDLYNYLKYIRNFLARWSFYKLFFKILKLIATINIILSFFLLFTFTEFNIDGAYKYYMFFYYYVTGVTTVFYDNWLQRIVEFILKHYHRLMNSVAEYYHKIKDHILNHLKSLEPSKTLENPKVDPKTDSLKDSSQSTIKSMIKHSQRGEDYKYYYYGIGAIVILCFGYVYWEDISEDIYRYWGYFTTFIVNTGIYRTYLKIRRIADYIYSWFPNIRRGRPRGPRADEVMFDADEDDEADIALQEFRTNNDSPTNDSKKLEDFDYFFPLPEELPQLPNLPNPFAGDTEGRVHEKMEESLAPFPEASGSSGSSGSSASGSSTPNIPDSMSSSTETVKPSKQLGEEEEIKLSPFSNQGEWSANSSTTSVDITDSTDPKSKKETFFIIFFIRSFPLSNIYS